MVHYTTSASPALLGMAALLTMSGAACGSDETDGASLTPAALGVARATLGAAGGTLSLGACTVVIPAGALTQETQVELVATTSPDGGVGSAYELRPAGLVLLVPGTISFSYATAGVAPAAAAALRVGLIENGNWRVLPESVVDEAGETVRSALPQLATFGVILDEPPTTSCIDSSDCPQWMVCWQGQCTYTA